MNYLISLGAIFPILIIIVLSYPTTVAYSDPKHCQGYNACYSIGYRDGYNDAQNGVSPAYACVGHSENWCSGYNDGFRAGNGGSDIFYGPNTGQTASIDVHGNNNKISIGQQANNQVGDTTGFSTGHKENGRTALPKCEIFCFNSNIKIK